MRAFIDHAHIALDQIPQEWLPGSSIRVAILRLDQLHPLISGNKWFKLKYNLETAKTAGHSQLLTFGGAYSNHLVATACAAQLAGFRSIGVVRGEAPAQYNATLQDARQFGMKLHFVSRSHYALKDDPAQQAQWQDCFGDFYLIPEGGQNALSVKGCEEILHLLPTSHFTHICCAVGSGTTLAGLINAAQPHQTILGFSSLKGPATLTEAIRPLLAPSAASRQWQLINDYHFGGFAKTTTTLFQFMNDFYDQYHIPLDLVYTSKMIFGVKTLVQNGYFPENSCLLLIHTGGLQGNRSVKQGILHF